MSLMPALPTQAQYGAGVIRVAPSGADVEGCGSPALPCQTIQNAINLAVSGDTILVAEGVYTYNDAFDVCTGRILGTTAVACFFDKELTILGGYAADFWKWADPQAHPTIIDGENRWRGVRVLKTASWAPPASLRMEGFTVRNGVAQGRSAGGMEHTYAWGGGLFSEWAPVTLRHMTFSHNQAAGGNIFREGDGVVGAGAGGGVAINAVPQALLEHVIFDGNTARGGNGPTRGGYALGGGLFTYSTVATMSFITLTHNVAIAGRSDGAGRDAQSATADTLGGGASIQAYSTVTMQHVYAAENRAEAGAAPNGEAGGAYGGGINAELATLTLLDSVLVDNIAQGGQGKNATMSAAIAEGGGLHSINADMVIERAVFLRNQAVGGQGVIYGGAAGGGGAALTALDHVRPARVVNAIFAENLAAVGNGRWVGGGGGGLWVQGLIADVLHCTFADNRLGPGQTPSLQMQGQAIVVVGGWAGTTPIKTTANVAYTIIADHQNASNQAALHVQGDPQGIKQVANLTRGLWANNTRKTNLSDGQWAGVINGLGTMLSADTAGFAAPGAASYDYGLRPDSPARSQAVGSTLADDHDGRLRAWFAPSDIGAVEFAPIMLTARPQPGKALDLAWSINPAVAEETMSQYILVACPLGGVCPDPIGPLKPSVDRYRLTELPQGAPYTLVVEARDGQGAALERSNKVGLSVHYAPLLIR
jgi:hypothetical protein